MGEACKQSQLLHADADAHAEAKPAHLRSEYSTINSVCGARGGTCSAAALRAMMAGVHAASPLRCLGPLLDHAASHFLEEAPRACEHRCRADLRPPFLSPQPAGCS